MMALDVPHSLYHSHTILKHALEDGAYVSTTTLVVFSHHQVPICFPAVDSAGVSVDSAGVFLCCLWFLKC